ncbi:unnamed protein product [Dimorphilus gyrociliatus]|uniref:Potassium channel domain-containing protein n=1 Tax=Dimorphilus gyrociliatus TaxID=2664684 RepID=A0A7I8VG43_9ANNE|nr:unnamed protein product [Dimorphilus gyrociliatus]
MMKADSQRNEEQMEEEKLKEMKRAKMRNCCKKVLKFMFSHIGLCGMVIAYSVAGGFIFEHLERHNEKTECLKAEQKYLPAENSTVQKIIEIAQIIKENPEEATQATVKIIQRFRKHVLELNYDGKNCSAMGEPNGPGYRWSFSGALLFSVTVITTIGYGNIAPKTYWGRLVCIAYALLGIPLMLLCLANIGDVMADIFRFVYGKICCCGCCRKKGDKNKDKENESETGSKGRRTPEAWKKQYAGPGGQVVDDPEDDDEEEDEDEKISVPLTITMAVIAGYIFMGSLLFGVWEGWDALKASYFCFVTISTIGFGDVVPGSANFENAEDQYKMVLSAIYMLFGMAILSMCFSLIQEEIVAKFKWVGEKMGLLEKDEDQEDTEAIEKDSDDKKSNFSGPIVDPRAPLPPGLMKKGPPVPPPIRKGPPIPPPAPHKF